MAWNFLRSQALRQRLKGLRPVLLHRSAAALGAGLTPSPGGSLGAGPPSTGAGPPPSGSPAASTAVPRGAIQITPIANDHVMVTRGKHGFQQPRTVVNLQAITLSSIPKTYIEVLWPIRIGVILCRRNSLLSRSITLGILFLVHPALILLHTSGFFDINYIRMAPSTVTKLDRSFMVLPIILVLILVKLSVLLLSQPLYAQCSLWLSLRIGLSINWT